MNGIRISSSPLPPQLIGYWRILADVESLLQHSWVKIVQDTALTHVIIKDIYQSIFIPRLLYGAEVRYFHDNEINIDEQFYHDMARDI